MCMCIYIYIYMYIYIYIHRLMPAGSGLPPRSATFWRCARPDSGSADGQRDSAWARGGRGD